MSQLSGERKARLERLLAAGLAEIQGAARTDDQAVRQASLGARSGEIAPRGGGDRVPASFAQRRLWFLDRLQPSSLAYVVPAMLRVVGELDAAALSASLDALVRRHEALRTVFSDDGGELHQIVTEPAHVDIAFSDLSAMPPEGRERVWLSHLDPDAHEPFDLRRGPLVRAWLFKWAPGEHRLLVLLHHISVDGWSLGLLVHELAALYAGHAEPPPGLGYTDYAAWQQERVDSGDLDGQVAYWTRKLEGARPTELPSDRPRPRVMGWRGARRHLTLGDELAGRVRESARHSGASVFAVLLAGFNALLHRYGGQDEIVVGTPVAARTRPETERIVGMVANTLVLRTDLSGDPSFDELVARTRDVVLDAHSHQEVPFELLVERLRPERDPSRQPMFQIAFAMHNLPPFGRVEAGAVVFETLEMVGDVAKFDLSVLVSDVDGELRCEFEYNTDLFDGETIDRLMAHYRQALTGALAAPETRVSALTLIGPDEREMLLRRWSGTRRDYGDELVPQMIARRVAEAPEAVAVSTADRDLTYGQLDAAAGSVAARLAELGCGPGERVVVCARRSAELVIAVLGVMRAGGCYVPLDPAHPPERISALIASSGAIGVLTDGRDPVRCDVPVLPINGAGGYGPEVGPRPTQFVYSVFTSGSTGTPKGVLVDHKGLSNLVHWHLSAYGLDRSDRATLVASPGFDASAWEIWTALAAGASLHVPTDEVRADPAALAGWLAAEGITTTFLPTALAEAVMAEPLLRKASLRYLLTGGDALTRGPEAWTDGTLINHYGPTENTVVATAGETTTGERPPIGRPIDNVLAYVLDSRGEPVPVGVPGELFLGGAQVAAGYLGDPSRTAQRFLSDPFSGVPGARMYGTGDRVRWRADGQLDFLGRADDQVKIRGARIELGEVEAAVRAHPAVREAAVLVRGDDPVRRDLVAVVELADTTVPLDDIRDTVRRRLPAHMVPAVFAPVERIPLNASGKIDRRALSIPDAQQAARVVTEPPDTPAEEAVARVWCGLLGLERIDRRDNFFDLGGHSFLALHAQQELEAKGFQVSVVDIFQHPTPMALAAHLEGAARDEAARRTEAAHYAEQRRRALRRRGGRREGFR